MNQLTIAGINHEMENYKKITKEMFLKYIHRLSPILGINDYSILTDDEKIFIGSFIMCISGFFEYGNYLKHDYLIYVSHNMTLLFMRNAMNMAFINYYERFLNYITLHQHLNNQLLWHQLRLMHEIIFPTQHITQLPFQYPYSPQYGSADNPFFHLPEVPPFIKYFKESVEYKMRLMKNACVRLPMSPCGELATLYGFSNPPFYGSIQPPFLGNMFMPPFMHSFIGNTFFPPSRPFMGNMFPTPPQPFTGFINSPRPLNLPQQQNFPMIQNAISPYNQQNHQPTNQNMEIVPFNNQPN